MRFWDWALEAYRRSGVEPLCLDLQDAHGQSVPLLLWAAWAASSGRVPTEVQLRTAVEIARAWEVDVVGRLRAVRRALRAPPAGDDAPGFADLRRQVQSAELAGERLLMENLEMTAPPATRGPQPVTPLLLRVAGAWSEQPAPEELLERLAQRLPS